MQKRTLARRTLAVIPTLTLALGSIPALALTPQQIVQRCQGAYDALHTYQGNVTVTAATGMGGGQTYRTTAKIIFARPGHIRATGTSMFGSPFAYVSNGTATFQNIGGNWSKCQNAEMAIAGATGVAQSAATTIPALLLHTHWGSPFSRAEHFNPSVAQDAVDGRPCYRLNATNPAGSVIFWIDRQSFLLRRMTTTFAMGQMHLHQDEHIANGPLNAPAPNAAFALPPGHEHAA